METKFNPGADTIAEALARGDFKFKVAMPSADGLVYHAKRISYALSGCNDRVLIHSTWCIELIGNPIGPQAYNTADGDFVEACLRAGHWVLAVDDSHPDHPEVDKMLECLRLRICLRQAKARESDAMQKFEHLRTETDQLKHRVDELNQRSDTVRMEREQATRDRLAAEQALIDAA